MANFKGGFAFNNEAAKVEVEQSPNGALISCINPVTGESMGGGNPNSVQVIEGTVGDLFPVGTLTLEELEALEIAMESNSASIILTMDATELGITDPIIVPLMSYRQDEMHNYYNGAVMTSGQSVASGLNISYELQFASPVLSVLTQVNIADGAGTITDLRTTIEQVNIPTSTAIYWHPMPEAEGE